MIRVAVIVIVVIVVLVFLSATGLLVGLVGGQMTTN